MSTSWTRSGAMDKGFVWFALNNSKTDYINLSRKLAQSIKQVNRHNKVCIIIGSRYVVHAEHRLVVESFMAT